MTADALQALADRLGIAREYRDQEGITRAVPEATRRSLLGTFGFPVGADSDAADALRRLEQAEAEQALAPVVVLRTGAPVHEVLIAVAPEQRGHVHWELAEESGARRDGAAEIIDLPVRSSSSGPDRSVVRRGLALPGDIPAGYHRLALEIRGAAGVQRHEAALIVAPQRAYEPEAFRRGERLWGVAVQLYGLRSDRNWGIGDFTDLARLLRWAGAAGCAAIGVNPLHALFLDDPAHISPYSPSSRMFFNPLYLDVEAIAGFSECAELQQDLASPDTAAALRQLRAGELVDYPGVTRLKRRALEHLYRWHLRAAPDGGTGFAAFRDEQGEPLRSFAVFNALREHFGARDTALRDWRRWPAELQDPHSPAVAAFAQEHADAVGFFAWLQWQVAIQLQRCKDAARDAGMPIGIYLDLAVGTDRSGADAWAMPRLVASGASIGAPPDIWNRKGQNWGLPPLNTSELRRQAYRPFAELLRANMRWAGALRIDHVLGLQRLFWIPEGATPADGAYVAYPFDDLVAIVALESWRNRCLVIGEDLGTLPEGFQPAMRGAGLLSYCILYFERDGEGRFRPPSAYPAEAMVSISTHDLPPLASYWSGSDIARKDALSLLPERDAAERERRGRAGDRARLMEALAAERLATEGDGGEGPPVDAILRFIARTPCRMLMIGFEDLLGIEEQANVPGTTDEHPNWRRKLPQELDRLLADARVGAALRVLNEERPRRSGGATT